MPIDDPGLLYGATVFTTVRVYHQSLECALTNWTEHCDRLRGTIQTFGWQQPQWNRIRRGAEILITHFPILRITLFPDGREWITGRFLPLHLTEKQHHGISVWVAAGEQFERCLPGYKTGNYLSAWMAKNTAAQMGTGEAILVDANGNWLETSGGNLWGWLDGCWWTPPLEAGILPGVVRSRLISWLKSCDRQIREEPWLPDLVKRFVAIAITNSVVEVIPIHTVIEGQGGSRGDAVPCSYKGEGEAEAKINQLEYDPYHPGFQQLRDLFTHESGRSIHTK